ncbi:Transketolase [Hypoxylon texense]
MVKKSPGANSSRPPPPRPAASGSSASAPKSAAGSKSGPGPGPGLESAVDDAAEAVDKEIIGASPSPSTADETKPQQQRLLNIFHDAFKEVLSRDDFGAVLQEVKGALYRRDFETAFGTEQFLEVYAARYSPPRALCYSKILAQISGRLASVLDDAVPTARGNAAYYRDEVERGRLSPTVDFREEEEEEEEEGETSPGGAIVRMLAIGGAAAETVAFAEHLRTAGSGVAGDLTLLDVGPWQEVVRKLHAGLTTAPVLSKYASAAAKATNAALVEPPERLQWAFVQKDILELDRDGLSALLGGPAPLLVTMLFTLNELYTSGGVGKTTAFLRNLTAAIPAGSLLLVVDSPGSYSEAAVGKEAKKYPMQWLLDHTLLQAVDKLPSDGCTWEKLESHDSVWFRHPQGLRYSIELHDMRYQMHLYRAYPRSTD